MNAPFRSPEVRLVLCVACEGDSDLRCAVCNSTGREIVEVEPLHADDLAEDDRAFWAQVVREMKLKPGISPGPVNPDRSSFKAWR